MATKARQKKVLHTIAFVGAIAFLLGALIYLVIQAFSAGVLYGLRSIVACVLPLIVMVYVGSSTDIDYGRRGNQNFNLFFIYSIWTLMLLVLGSTWQFPALPLIELLISATLASILWTSKRRHSQSRVFASSYGVLTGLLAYVCFFGIILRGG